MDLTKQPPRRPSNTCMAGIVALARMADKARAANAETEGAYVFGEESGLDRQVLAFINMTHEEFAAAVEELDDEALGRLVEERAQKSAAEIAAFNKEQLEITPHDERHHQLLADRLARFAPGRTDITTNLQSIELDDWGLFREKDLTQGPPRTPYLRSVHGVVAVARMSDKARASRAGRLGEYKYGPDSPLDVSILEFLSIEAGAFVEAAYQNPNDDELGDWVREQTSRSAPEISGFNVAQTVRGRAAADRERFLKRRAEICPERGDINTWFNLMDYDDQQSFALVDLTRRPPRSPYDTEAGGIVGLARMIDKGRAFAADTIGEYWFGQDSGIDRAVLEFLGMTQEEFTGGLDQCPTDEALVAWLGARLDKPGEQVEGFNQKLANLGPSTDAQWEILRRNVAALDPSRTELASWFALSELDDRVSFARLHSGI